MIIGVTDTMGSERKLTSYIDWLHSGSAAIECRLLSYALDNLPALEDCDALVLAGGHDVEPALYGGPLHHPKIKNSDPARDTFERKALENALHNEIPVLGICRGIQLANVHFGGSLIPDIEDAGFASHRSEGDDENRHAVEVQPGSLLHGIVGVERGTINTSHHQAVLRPGKGLKVTARAADGIVEALEYEDPTDRQFFLLVQWHPERMEDRTNPFALSILRRFIGAAAMVYNRS